MVLSKVKTAAVLALGVALITLGSAVCAHAWQKPEAGKASTTGKAVDTKDDPTDLDSAVDGRIVRSAEVTKDCMVLAYMPAWNHGTVDNIGIGNNGGGVRTLVDWPDVPASEAKSANLKSYLAFYSRKTMSSSKPGSILAFEIKSDWPELTSWTTLPAYEPEPVVTTKFEPGEGWKLFDITEFVRERQGKSGQGLLLRFLNEDRGKSEDAFSDYKLISRENDWPKARPRLLVVDPSKK